MHHPPITSHTMKRRHVSLDSARVTPKIESSSSTKQAPYAELASTPGHPAPAV